LSKSASLTESQWLAEVERLAAESRPHQVTIPEDVMHRIDLARNRPRPLSWPKLTKLLIDTGLMPKGTKSHTISEIWRKSQVGC
jgi:hypothetical protein